MIVPESIKKILKERERVAARLVKLDTKINNWLSENHIFNEIVFSDKYSLFNGGYQEFMSNSANKTIDYLENLHKEQNK